MAVTILPGVDEYLARGVKNLGDTISLFTETDRRTQRAIRNMMLENPDMAQKFADLEHREPGTLKKLGFGGLADSIMKLGPSLTLQREQLLGQETLEAEQAELGMRTFRNERIQQELERDPNISALQAGALVSQALGIPREAELESEVLDNMPKELQAQRALIMMREIERGENVEGSMMDFAYQWMRGTDDMETTNSILAHPLLGPQFEKMVDLLLTRENQAHQKDLASIRVTNQRKIPVGLQNQLTELASVKPLIDIYGAMLGEWFKLPRAARVMAMAGRGSKQNQELAGSIQSMRQQLAGRLRLAVIGPGAVSDQERKALMNAIGNATSIGALIRDPQFTFGQFNTMKASISQIETVLQRQAELTGGATWTIEMKNELINEMISQGYENDAIKEVLERIEREGGE